MATTVNMLDLMPKSTNPQQVIEAQNSGVIKIAQAREEVVDSTASQAKEILQQKTALASEQIQNEQVYREFIANLTRETQQELAGTQQVIDANQAAYAKKSAEFSETTRTLNETSFWRNPVAFIRGSVRASDQRGDLLALVRANQAAKIHQGSVYAEANEKLRVYEATVRNLSFAELQQKQNTLSANAEAQTIDTEAAMKKLSIAENALLKQRGYEDPSAKSKDSRDREFVESSLFRFMHRFANNGDDSTYNAESAKLQSNVFQNLTPPEQRNLTLAVSRLANAPELTPLPNETPAEFQQRKLDTDISILSNTVGTNAAELVAKLGSSSFNNLLSFADTAAKEAVTSQFSPTTVDNRGKVVPKDSATLKADQQKAAAMYQGFTVDDKLRLAELSFGNEITTRAANSSIPPLAHAGASELMRSANIDPSIADWFDSEESKAAIDLPIKRTFKQASDVALNLFENLKDVPTSSGKPLTDAQRAEVVSKYLKQSYLADYMLNSGSSDTLKELYRLKPGMTLQFQIPVQLAGKAQSYNLADPTDVLNLYTYVRKQETIKKLQQDTMQSMIDRGVRLTPPQ
jgi:hypothetical protein